MKQLSPTLFIMNDIEKQKILTIIRKKDKQAFIFYKSLFKYPRIPTFFIDDILIFIANSKLIQIIENLKLINSTMNISKIIDISPDCNQLQDFQKKSFDKLNSLINISGYYKGLLIGDEPGLGKTLTSICIVKSYLEYNSLDLDDVNIVVSVPLTLVTDWVTSLTKYFPGVSISTNPEAGAKILVVNYEKLNKVNCVNSILIIDEAHNFHNIESNRYKALFNQAISANLVLLLTGTPIRESVLNLLSLYALLDYKLSDYIILLKLMELLKKFYKYVFNILIKKFSNILSRSKKSEVFDNVGATSFKPILFKVDAYLLRKNNLTLDQIDKRMSQAIDVISEFNARAKKNPNYSAVKKMITKYINDISIENIYNSIKASNKNVDLKLVKMYLDIISYNTKQAYNSKIWHSLLDDTIIFIANNNMNKFVELINTNKKILIVSKSRKAVQFLYKKFKSMHIQGLNITANDSASERFNKIKDFEIKSSNKFLISTYPIIEAGVNLPFVDLILLLDLPYRPHSLEQVINRTQRLSNLQDPINIRYIKLDYKYNILEHHYLLLKEISRKVNQVILSIEKEL